MSGEDVKALLGEPLEVRHEQDRLILRYFVKDERVDRRTYAFLVKKTERFERETELLAYMQDGRLERSTFLQK